MRAFAKYKLARWSALLLLLLPAFEPAAYAQYEAPAIPPPPNAPIQAQPAFSQQELDQMLAPIAIYPDPLLSQILMASTYPLEVVEAARWSRANPNLRGDDAVRTVQQMDWDPSVKSLVAFPQILQMMDERLDWTERLGDAFLAQEPQVMDTVQNLRQRAYAAGNLRSNDQIRVEPEGQTIVVEPANPEIVYVPYYDPRVVYGPWWCSDYPPIFWAPWPGYYFDSGFAWGIGITLTTGFFFGDLDWHHHRANVINVNNYYYNRNRHVERNPARNVNHAPGIWQHDPDHRRGVPYRDPSLRQHYRHGIASPDARRGFRGFDHPSINDRNERSNRQIERGSVTVLPNRSDNTRGQHDASSGMHAETRSNAGGQANRLFERDSRVRPSTPRESTPREASRPAVESRPHAFEDIGRGANVRNFSLRGHASHEGGVHSQSSTPAQRASGGAAGGEKQHSMEIDRNHDFHRQRKP